MTGVRRSAPAWGGGWSLAARLTAWFAATAFLLVSGAAWMQYRVLATDLAAEDDQLLVDVAAAAVRDVDLDMVSAWGRDAVPPGGLGPLIRQVDGRCRVVRGAWPADTPPPDCEAGPRAAPGPDGVVLRTWHAATGRPWRVARARRPAGAPGWIEVALDRSTDARLLAEYRRQIALVLGAALVLAGALGYALARRGLAPLGALAARVARIDARSLDERLDVPGSPAEVQRLLASFDGMRGRLARAFDALTQSSAELAHEFRTPLHVMRQQTEVALVHERTPAEYREVLGSTLEEVERLRRMVDDALFLARAEDPRARVERTSVDVRAELDALADYLEALATEQGVTLAVDAPPDLIVAADRTLLRRAVVNLTTNALRHTPSGGRVTLAARRLAAEIEVTVTDTGPGVPPDLLSRVFDPYVRGPRSGAGPSDDGSGLGLAIVRGIMQLHEGRVEVANTPGRGARFALLFPFRLTSA